MDFFAEFKSLVFFHLKWKGNKLDQIVLQVFVAFAILKNRFTVFLALGLTIFSANERRHLTLS